ncbi:unnamed protein product [Boreogadus saida]
MLSERIGSWIGPSPTPVALVTDASSAPQPTCPQVNWGVNDIAHPYPPITEKMAERQQDVVVSRQLSP